MNGGNQNRGYPGMNSGSGMMGGGASGGMEYAEGGGIHSYAQGGATDIRLTEDPNAFLQGVSADQNQITGYGNLSSGEVAPRLDYSASVDKNKKASVRANTNIGDWNIEGSVIKDLINQQNAFKLLGSTQMGSGNAFIQAEKTPQGNMYGAGMRTPYMGGNLQGGVNKSDYGTSANVGFNYPLGGRGMGFAQGGLASLRHNAFAVKAQGRHGDNTLLHANTDELRGLATLIGRPLTTNPHTGLPEAFGWKSLVPMLAAAAATAMSGGAAAPLLTQALAAGAGGFAGSKAIGMNTRDALTQGLIAGGTAGVLGGIAGPEGAVTTPANTPALPTAAPSVPVPAGLPPISPPINASDLIKANEAELLSSSSEYYPKIETNNLPQPMQTAAATQLPSITPPPVNPADIAKQQAEYAARGAEGVGTPTNAITRGIGNITSGVGDYYDKVAAGAAKDGAVMNAVKSPYGAAAGLGLFRQSRETGPAVPPEERKSNYQAQDPYDRKAQFPGANNPYAEYNYFPGNRFARAQGGEVHMAQGGLAAFDKGGAASAVRAIRRTYKTREEAAKAGVNPYLLNYAFGQGEVVGKGDGMSDHVPARIDGGQEARLSDGEFIIPADVVSGLGNGSTKAGSDALYKMLDKVRHARTGTKKQGKQIKPERLMPV